MEQRKIISLGRSSLVVSLPKHWVELNELKQGDTVSMAIQRDRSLIIFPGGGKKRESMKITIEIDPDEKADSIARKVIGCYMNGYFGVRLVSKKIFTVAQQRAIRDIARKLYMRIMESDSKSIYIQTLIDETKVSIETAVRRMHAIAISMYRDVLNSLRDRDKGLAKIVYSLDNDVDHFSFFILRLLRTVFLNPEYSNYLGIEPIDCLDYQTLVHRIEQVADHAANIAKTLIMLEGENERIPEPIMELILKSGNEVFEAYNKAVNAFFAKDVAEANRIVGLQQRIERLDREIYSKFFTSEPRSASLYCAVCSIRDNIKHTLERAIDIAEITINLSYKMS